MAFETVKDLSTDVVHKLGGGINKQTKKPNPNKIEGYYLGSRTVQTVNGDAKIHVFQTPKGNEGVWGTKELNDKLGQVKEGTMTLVNYGGKKALKGGKTLHTYTVAQDKENTVAVEGAGSNSSESYVEEDADDSPSEVTEDEAEYLAAQEEASALLAAERAAKAAKVQEIMNRGKAAKAGKSA